MRRRLRKEGGASAVELALVAPILFLLLFGVLQYGYHYWALETASATAREAARRYAVGTQQACTVDEAKSNADTAALGPVTVTSSPAVPKVGDVVTVTVSFQSLDLHLLPLPGDGVITQLASARVETVPATPIAC